MSNRHTNVETLKNHGFVVVDHQIHPETIDSLIQAYADFTDNHPDPEPATINAMITNPDNLDELDYSADRQHDWHKYRTNHPQLGKPGGYTNRTVQVAALRKFGRSDEADDPKEFYHYHPNSLAIMKDYHDHAGWKLPPEVNRLHDAWGTVHSLGLKAIKDMFAEIEETHPELLSRVAPPEILDNSPSRLLFYHPGQGDVLAAGHHDKSLGTLQIAESHRGLRLRNQATGEMEEIVRPPEKGVFFIGGTLKTAYPDSELSSGWHDVINIDQINESRALHGNHVARWAIILFANSNHTNIFTKAMAHNEELDA